jgi:hypothetical protein
MSILCQLLKTVKTKIDLIFCVDCVKRTAQKLSIFMSVA